MRLLSLFLRFFLRAVLPIVLVLPSARAAVTPGVVYAWGDNTIGQIRVPNNLGSVIGISAGQYHSIAIRPDGSLATWGTFNDPRLQIPSGLPPIKAVAAGGLHSLALGTNGVIYAWGDNGFGQITPPSSIGTVIAIAAGENHSVAVRANGTVLAWGNNDRGQAPPDLTMVGVSAVAAGGNHNLALFSDGHIKAWGDNSLGQSRIDPNLPRMLAVAAGALHSLGLRSDQKVEAWGDNHFGQSSVPSDLSNVIAIAAGGNFSMALTADHKLRVWGETTFSQQLVPSDLLNPLKIAVGSTHCLAISVDPPVITKQPADTSGPLGGTAFFTVEATGSAPLAYRWRFGNSVLLDATNNTLVIQNLQPAKAGKYSVAIENEAGGIVSSNATLVIRTPPIITQQPENVTVGVGAVATFRVVAAGGNLAYRWRKEGVPIPGAVVSAYSIPLVQVSNSGNYDVVITNSFGSVTSIVAVLSVQAPPTFIKQPEGFEAFPGTSAFLSVEAANTQTYQWYHDAQIVPGATQSRLNFNPIQSSDHGSYRVVIGNPWASNTSVSVNVVVSVPATFSEVAGWGESQVWNGVQFVDVSPPAGLSDVQQVAAGRLHSLALRRNGTVIGWGDNLHGEASPPSGLNAVTALAAGDGFSLGLLGTKKVVGWGRSDLGQANPPPELSNVRAIAAGTSHALALREDGSIVAWGSNSEGESTVLPGLGKAIGIAAGDHFNLVLLEDGTVTGWGQNDFGQRRPPQGLSNVVAVAAGRAHSLALLEDGRIVAWGDDSSGQTQVPPLPRAAIGIMAGANHSLALLENHNVIAWGKNNAGQLDIPQDLQQAIGIGASADRSLAIRLHSLKFLPMQLVAGRKLRIQVANTDGTPIDEVQAATILVYLSPSLDAPLSQWTPSAPLSLVDGVLRLLETIPATESVRFYQAVENP